MTPVAPAPLSIFRCVRSLIAAVLLLAVAARGETIALWLFDEQVGVYPSSILNDAGPNAYFLVLGRGGEITKGRFGNALHPITPGPFSPVFKAGLSSAVRDGLEAPLKAEGRTVEPLSWRTATFAAGFLNGDKHLRRQAFASPTDSPLNIGATDFTIEFWLKVDTAASGDGVVFELGSGPRGENDVVTRLSFSPAKAAFEFSNQPSRTHVTLASDAAALRSGKWVHCALVYDSGKGLLRHFANGRSQSVTAVRLKALPKGDEDYWSIARDGTWQQPLPGAIDELRLSDHQAYVGDFKPPASFSRLLNGKRQAHPLLAGPPLLFPGNHSGAAVLDLGSRRHLFLDDVLLSESRNVTFTPHPARIAERVLEASGWISVVDAGPEDIRLYVNGPRDSVAVFTSKDGVKFVAPDLGREFGGKRNIAIKDPATVGNVFIDPNGHGDERWKLVSGLRQRGGIFTYTSADGYTWLRNNAASLPFWAGSAENVFYDDQRQCYVLHHRTDYYSLANGSTERKMLLMEATDLLQPWPFQPVTSADTRAALEKGIRIQAKELDPWWLDNGPLAPGGFGLEYPIAFEADPRLDPEGTDVYNTRAQKYAWAEDAYVAFPLLFFHYHTDGPPQRRILARADEQRGTGLVETQLAVSRDGLNWKRYPRPAYVGVGEVDGYAMRRPYTGYGMVRRGREIWQYAYTRSTYHDPYQRAAQPDVIHRLVQRTDGFVSLDGAYTGGEFVTKPFRFTGNRLVLNVDTEATGYLQLGFVDERNQPIPGFSVDEGIYVNGDEIDYEVEWLAKDLRHRTKDLSALSRQTVRLVGRIRGASLYALQFVQR